MMESKDTQVKQAHLVPVETLASPASLESPALRATRDLQDPPAHQETQEVQDRQETGAERDPLDLPENQ